MRARLVDHPKVEIPECSLGDSLAVWSIPSFFSAACIEKIHLCTVVAVPVAPLGHNGPTLGCLKKEFLTPQGQQNAFTSAL